MRLDRIRPPTRVLAVLAGLAMVGWVLALAGFGADAPVVDVDPGLVRPVAQLQASPDTHLAPLAEYTEAASRPVFARDRRPHAFVLAPGEHMDLASGTALGGVERVDVYTTMLSNGDLFYLLTVVPEREGGTYQQAFSRVVQTVRINDR